MRGAGDDRPRRRGWGLGLHRPLQPGPVKREGDGRAPAGVFAIGKAFGYAASAATALPYAAMDAPTTASMSAGRRCTTASSTRKVVGAVPSPGSTEPMRRDLHADGDQRYRLGFVIEHNAAGRPAAGSCIFAHLWKSPDDATAGCTAMDDAVMTRLLSWLRPDAAAGLRAAAATPNTRACAAHGNCRSPATHQ